MKSYADGGDNAKLKAFAAETAPKIQMHFDMVKQIDTFGRARQPGGQRQRKPMISRPPLQGRAAMGSISAALGSPHRRPLA